jgi:hypothetical protein
LKAIGFSGKSVWQPEQTLSLAEQQNNPQGDERTKKEEDCQPQKVLLEVHAHEVVSQGTCQFVATKLV